MNNNNKLKGRFICLFFVLVGLASCQQKAEIKEYKLAGEALGTSYHITYIGEELVNFSSQVDSMVSAINHSLSTYQPNSYISAFNENRLKDWKKLNDTGLLESDLYHFVRMLELSKEISQRTHGAFDPSAKLLFDVYGAAKKSQQFMDSTEVQMALSHQGMDKIELDDARNPYKLDSLVQLNFNAIAKGYMVDIIADFIQNAGIENYMVEVGGEMRLGGQNAESTPWQVGINIPKLNASPTDFFKILALENVALATSGNYQNYYLVDNQLVGHTLDPRNGKPVICDLKSASILHDKCAVADAYATACMVMGLEQSKALIAQDTSLSAYFIYEIDGELKGEFVE